MNKKRGFTLIELMVTVAIIAILAAIALPNYTDHVRKGRRASAQTFLTEAANRQAQFLLDARNYAVGSAALTTLNMSVPTEVSRYYDVTVDPAAATNPPSFTITATPVVGAGQVVDGVITLDNLGTKTRNGQPW